MRYDYYKFPARACAGVGRFPRFSICINFLQQVRAQGNQMQRAILHLILSRRGEKHEPTTIMTIVVFEISASHHDFIT